ncbi:MAG: energy-coupling factor ABC transporter permease [Oscillospiraceae bacterium]|jgi:cobalt/nickel transport system permease protein|nr:energy-coupling factor ABC transporter permease [Oscillospiraceae bacterium]
MHIATTLISAGVALGAAAASTGAGAYSVRGAMKDKAAVSPLLTGAAAAFVFGAQMVNFTIPGTGSSGHIVGAVLLAALLGPYRSFLSMAAILLMQCLLFGDGGAVALGVNIFNMGVIPCLVVYPFVVKPLTKKLGGNLALFSGSVLSAVVGAFAVTVETTLSGITALPFLQFAERMLPVHLAIGAVEGAVAVVVFVVASRLVSVKAKTAFFGGAALLASGAVSLLASTYPDGLEWSVGGLSPTLLQAESFTGLFGGYGYVTGIIGTVAVFAFVFALTAVRKKRA